MEQREERDVSQVLAQVAIDQIRQSFKPEYRPQVPEEEGLGTALACHYKWDGLRILKTMYAALEDANFHKENETVERWIRELEHGK